MEKSGKRIAIFSSGSGSNMANIADYFNDRADVEVAIVICNNPKAYVLQRAIDRNIPTALIHNDKLSNGMLPSILRRYKIDLVVLAGFLRLVPSDVIAAFPNKIVNIHPALLPKFGGKGMYGARVHKAVVAASETVSGITIHYVSEHYDEGAVIAQFTCPVLPVDTPEMVELKVRALEIEHYPATIAQVLDAD